MKKFILSTFVCLASVVAYFGIYPTCWGTLYQPTVPKQLIK